MKTTNKKKGVEIAKELRERVTNLNEL